MSFLLLFAFVSGLLTILAPCIWPLLPIILSATTTSGKRKPLGITVGILVSFTVFTLSISYLISLFHFDPNNLRLIAVGILFFLGLALIFPQLSARLEGLASRIGRGGRFSGGDGLVNGLVTGISLGIVWAPCAGPILATIAALAATQMVTAKVVTVTLFYMLGTGIPLFLFTTLGSRLFNRSKKLSPYLGRIQQLFGVIMIATAVAIWGNYDKLIQAKLLDIFPAYQNLLFKLEENKRVQEQLAALRGRGVTAVETKSFLPDLGPAAEFGGIYRWLNSQPLTMAGLRGRVVLVDFWTYSCINCIRTLPFVTGWYSKYKDAGLVVVGVHTPEFQFEKKTENVAKALKMFGINYPVAQDNDYVTWNNFNNSYWPAKYLIDKNGHVRLVHFGEGSYEEVERAIQSLLSEMGQPIAGGTLKLPDQTPTINLTPETYLGLARMEFLSSPEKPLGGEQKFSLPMNLPNDHFAFGGTWDIGQEEAMTVKNSVLELKFLARKVFLVIIPKDNHDLVKVVLDGKTGEGGGADVVNEMVRFNGPKLYELINIPGEVKYHRLRLEFNTPGTKVFAFTFG